MPIDAPPAVVAPSPIHNYLKGAVPRERCGERAADGEVVVCGRADLDRQYRLDPTIATEPAPRLPQAEMKLGSGTVKLHTGSGIGPQAPAAPAAMVTVTFPF